jgi:hypothetical protein
MCPTKSETSPGARVLAKMTTRTRTFFEEAFRKEKE